MFRIEISDRIRVPKKAIPMDLIRDRYDVELFDEQKCGGCDNRPDRAPENELCRECKAFGGSYRFFSTKELKENKVYALPQGDEFAVRKALDTLNVDYKWVDKRPIHKMRVHDRIKFTGTLYTKHDKDDWGNPRPDQREACIKWWKKKVGVIQAPARSGKCIVGSTIINTSEGFVHLNEIISKSGYHRVELSVDSHKGIKNVSHTYKSKDKTIKIETRNGFTIEGTYEHPMLVLCPDLVHRWKRLDQLSVGDWIVSRSKKNNPMFGSGSVNENQAIIMGYLLANGRRNVLSTLDPKVAKRFNKAVFEETGKICTKKTFGGRVPNYHLPKFYYSTVLKALGYQPTHSGDKEVPHSIRTAPERIIKAFLNAYFECDCGVNGSTIVLTSKSSKLIEQLHVLLYHAFDILGKRSSKFKQATNSATPISRRYHTIALVGSNVRKFLDTFSKAKANNFSKRFEYCSIHPSHQEHFIDEIPYINPLIWATFFKARSSTNPRDNRVQTRFGDLVFLKNHLAKGKSGSYRYVSRNRWNNTEWSELIANVGLLDKKIAKNLHNIVEKEYHYEEIISLKESERIKAVYDITVPEGHAFTANCLVSHNTVIATALYSRLGVRTVIIAAKKELLNQFYETACGVPAPRYLRGKFVQSEHKAGRAKTTNIPTLQRKTGRQIIFKPKSYGELIRYMKTHKEVPDVLLITYQSFARDLKRVQRVINKYYSLAIIDEEHGAGADGYLSFVASLNLRYRLGLSATPDRKDMRSDLTKLVYGGVVSRIRTTTLKPHIRLKHSSTVPSIPHKTWTGAFKWMVHNKKRNIEIVKEVFKDLREGHNTIIVPVDYKSHVNLLVRMINHQAQLNWEKKGENWPEELARPFHAQLKDRLATLVWADTDDGGKVHKKLPTRSPRVLVAIRSMVKEGVDLKRPSKIHIVMPMSAKKGVGAPAFQQLSMRVATPFTGKPEPECTIWLDNVGMFASCVSGLIFNEILPRTSLGKAKHPQYQLSPEDYAEFKKKIAFVQGNVRSAPAKRKKQTAGYW